MNSDFYYQIGSKHDFCQDYAIARELNEEGECHAAIVADGCSQSGQYCPVDFGARILAHKYEQQLKDFYPNMLEGDNINDDVVRLIGKSAIWNAKFSLREYDLTASALDATLVSAVTDGKTVHSFIYGDGCIVFRYTDGTCIIDSVEYLEDNNVVQLPFYPSYWISNESYLRYVQDHDIRKIVRSDTFKDGKVSRISRRDYDAEKPYYATDDVAKDLESVSVISDGLYSFKKGFGILASDVFYGDILKDIVDFVQFKGEFVKRNLKHFNKEWIKKDFHHIDDLSIASIYLNPEEN